MGYLFFLGVLQIQIKKSQTDSLSYFSVLPNSAESEEEKDSIDWDDLLVVESNSPVRNHFVSIHLKEAKANSALVAIYRKGWSPPPRA
ncbi:MAG: hypothetical protein ACK57K_00750 [Chryseotalea sp.]|jgi:hypothetical protein